MSFEVVLRIIGGIVAGLMTSELVSPTFMAGELAPSTAVLLFLLLVLLGFTVGFALMPYVSTVPFYWFRERVLLASGPDFLAGTLGLAGGLVCGGLLAWPLSKLPGWPGDWLPIVGSALLGYLGVEAALHHKHDVLAALGGTREAVRAHTGGGGEHALVDTSAIIDGRIAEVAETGFLFCTLVVPRFVLGELQQVADSSDAGKRTRGRRGLDILDRLQKTSLAPVEIADLEVEGPLDVDSKLVRLAKNRDWALLTNDFNLNKVAALQGIRVLNLNELANRLKPMCIPGDPLYDLRIVDKGQQSGQGVGFLSDGTMVVVEGAEPLIGQVIDCVVTRSLQTAMGRMIFAKSRERPEAG
ncbi:MAG TPA: PIN domain nuclease [Chloroflexota bacterium]